MDDYIEQAKASMKPTAITSCGRKCFIWGAGAYVTTVYADTFDEAVMSMAIRLKQIDDFWEKHKCRLKK